MGTFKKAAMLFAAFTLLSITSIFAATGWTRVDYTSSTTFIGYILEADGFVTGAQPGDSIGAFVEGECRMKAELFYGPNNDTLFVSSVIHGGGINPPNDPDPVSNVGETVTFQIWRANGDKVELLAGSTTTEPGGDIFMYPLGKTEISDDATLATIEVADVTLDPAFDATVIEYTVEIPAGNALPAETDYTVTTTNADAAVSIDYATDFITDSLTVITVTAQDGTTEIVYTITYTQLDCAVAAPTVDATETICDGETTTVTASGEATATFEWKNEAGEVVSSEAELGTDVAGTYTVTQTLGCTGVAAPVEVIVTPLPVIVVATDNILSNPVCSSSTVSLVGVATPAGGDYSGTGVTGDATNGYELTASSAGDVEYSVEVDGCTAKEVIPFTVVTPPTADLTGLPVAVCDSDVEFDLEGGTPADGVYSIDGKTVTSFDPALYSGDVEVTYTASTAAGCEDDAKATISVNAIPAKLAITDQTVVLPATAVAFTFETAPAAGATVIWHNEAGDVIIGADESFVPTETVAAVYTYTATQKIGDCESEPTTVKLTVTACDAQKPALDKATETVCAGTAVSFTATPDTDSEIIWTDNDGKTIAAVNNTITPSTDADGTFYFYASQQSTAANSCESPQAKVTLVVNKVPEVSITVPSTPLTVSSDAVEILVSPSTAVLTGTGITTNNMFDPAVAGKGTHTLNATITVSGCEGSDTKDITVSDDVVSNEALLAAITTAEALTATTGFAKDEYIDPTDANTALATAIATAKTNVNSTDVTVLASATSAMNAAITAFKEAANPIDYTALKAALDAADAKIVTIGTNVGTEAGQYKTTEVADLTAAITNGKTLYGSDNATVVATATGDIIAKTDITPIKVIAIDYDALEAAINAADQLILTTTEGTAPGEYAVGAKATLQAVIGAKDDFLTSTVQDDVDAAADAINAAITEYKTKVNPVVNTQALIDAIEAANTALTSAVEGYEISEYVDLATADDAINAAIKAAENALAGFGTAGTAQDVIDATKAMTDATSAFQALANKVDYSDLADAITVAEAKVATIGTNIGTGEDQYDATAVNALNTVILDAKALLGSTTSTSEIGAMITDLETKTAISTNGGTTVDYSSLETAITAAEKAYDEAVVGTGNGEYTQADKDALQAAIDAAMALKTSTDQAAVTTGAGTLDDAVSDFKKTIIVISLDVTDLEDAIEHATSMLQKYDIGTTSGTVPMAVFQALNTANDDAEDALKTVKTAGDVASEAKKLNDAIDLFLSGIITAVDANDVTISIYPTIVTETLTIEGLESGAVVSIATSTGVIVFEAKTSAEQILIPASELASGFNIITITLSDGSIVSGKVNVQ